VRVVEIASAAPAPFACMVLADLGADVLRVNRAPHRPSRITDPLARGRSTIAVDLKSGEGQDVVRRLAGQADVLVEGFRPGVAERLGIGPQDCRQLNPRLIYGRMTGWGQTGPLAERAGHDINYISVAGALEPIGRPGGRPLPPLNLVGDFGGGGLLLALGILAALHERNHSGLGQVVDAAMVDGATLLTAWMHGQRASGYWSPERGTNLLDGGAPFYDTYETADGKYVSVGALERRFYAQLLSGLGLDPAELPDQYDQSGWPELRSRFETAFLARTRDEWEKVFANTDACVTPVLSPEDAPHHPHVRARKGFVEVEGMAQPAPAPRFSRTPGAVADPAGDVSPSATLGAWGFPADEVSELTGNGTVS
jgi:alpha-methylacyl-CoA racemase